MPHDARTALNEFYSCILYKKIYEVHGIWASPGPGLGPGAACSGARQGLAWQPWAQAWPTCHVPHGIFQQEASDWKLFVVSGWWVVGAHTIWELKHKP